MEGSPLLDLAAELRNEIWRLVLVEDNTIDIGTTAPSCLEEKPPAEPALLTACKQVREEAVGIYYSENTFRMFCTPRTMISCARDSMNNLRWLERFSPDRAGMIKSFSIKMLNDHTRISFTMCGGVRRFRIDPMTGAQIPTFSQGQYNSAEDFLRHLGLQGLRFEVIAISQQGHSRTTSECFEALKAALSDLKAETEADRNCEE